MRQIVVYVVSIMRNRKLCLPAWWKNLRERSISFLNVPLMFADTTPTWKQTDEREEARQKQKLINCFEIASTMLRLRYLRHVRNLNSSLSDIDVLLEDMEKRTQNLSIEMADFRQEIDSQPLTSANLHAILGQERNRQN